MRNIIAGYMVGDAPAFSNNHGLQSLETGTEINLSLSSQRYCIGYDDPRGGVVSCPHETVAMQGAQCLDCLDKARLRPCLMCIGATCGNPARRQKCVFTDHYVYLAAYDLETIKVGVTKSSRLPERIREQGALGAIAIAAAGGQEVRRIEHAINQAGWRDRVNLLPMLCSGEINASDCEAHLREELHRVRGRVGHTQFMLEGSFVWCAESYPAKLDFPPRQLDPRTDPVAGIIMGIRGGLLLIDVGGEPIACALRSLVGREILAMDEAPRGPAQGAFVF